MTHRDGKRAASLTLGIAALLLGAGCGGGSVGTAVQASSPVREARPWVLTWSDEFNAPSGSAPDSSKWVIETGGHGWGNNELEYYTTRAQNVRQENGELVIAALQETYTGPDQVSRNFTSARLKTLGLFTQAYGRFEARIKIPQGQGVWPTFWMLGGDSDAVGWPACGEIDIMENIGSEPSRVTGSLHGPGYSRNNPLTGAYTLPSGGRFSDDYHVFAIEWDPGVVRFFVDDNLYATRTASDVPSGGRWVFDHPFYLLLNIAVGGDYPGPPGRSTVFPQTMRVDYVRVYSLK